MFLGCVLIAEGIWKGDIFVADTEELETVDAAEILEGSMLKKCYRPKRGEHVVFLIADGSAKLFGRDHGVRESTQKAGTTCKE